MHTAMPEKELKEVLDQVTRKVTRDSTGIQLVQGAPAPGGQVYTVHIRFRRGFHSSLSLRVDAAMLTRLTQSMLKKEQVTLLELEAVAKEYLNLLCGHIATALYKATRVAARFSVPTFHSGSYSPEGHREQFALHYFGDRNEAAQLVHHVPALPEGAAGGTGSKSVLTERRNSNMAKRVMVVDDSMVQEVLIRNMLEGTDYEVAHYCRSGEDALAVYDQVKPDVVTMDIIMPGMDGLETAQAILEEYPDAKIVMVSSLAYDDTFDEAKTIGAKAFIDKPFDKQTLLAALDRAEQG